MENKTDDMPNVIFAGAEPSYKLHLGESGNFWENENNGAGFSEYTKTSTVNKQVREALDKALESANVLQSSGSLNIFSLRLKIIDLKKQYPIKGE